MFEIKGCRFTVGLFLGSCSFLSDECHHWPSSVHTTQTTEWPTDTIC